MAVSLARHNKRRDANERQIAETLERAGFEVWHTDRPADLLIWRHDKGWRVLEVKTAQGRLSPQQRADREAGRGLGILTVRSAIEALRAVGAISEGYAHEQ